MGEVHLAYDPELDRKVAIKLLRPDGHGDSDRLLREAQALGRVKHKNVVTVYDVGRVDEQVYLTMEFIEGGTLGEWAEHTARWQSVLDVAMQVAAGLAAVHELGLTHRDIKPSNVMVDETGRAVLMDFGIARLSNAPPSEDEELASLESGRITDEITRASQIMGTPAYMAPEQFDSASVGPQADQFSFCVTAWRCVYGVAPFEHASLPELVYNLNNGAIQAPPRRGPRWLRRVLERGLSSTPGDRWDSMTELVAALERGKRTPRRVAVALVGVATLGAFGGVVGHRAVEQAQVRATQAQCREQANAIDEVWNADKNRAAVSAIHATGVANAGETATKFAELMDGRIEGWRRTAEAVCLASSAGEWDSELSKRAAWCLEDRRLSYQALVRTTQTVDETSVLRVSSAVGHSDWSAPCGDRSVLERLPVPATGQEELDGTRMRLAEATALKWGARYAEALPLIAQTVLEAESHGWAPLVARARASESEILERTGKLKAAEEAGRTAYFLAAGSGAWETAAQAALSVAWVRGYQQADLDGGLLWVDLADLAHGQVPTPDAGTVIRRKYVRAAVYFRSGDAASAEVGFTETLETITDLGHFPLKRSAALTGLAGVRLMGDNGGEALSLMKESISIKASVLGDTHPSVLRAQHSLAHSYAENGELETARDIYAGLGSKLASHFGADSQVVAETLLGASDVHRALGDCDAAIAAARDAVSIREQHFETGNAALRSAHATLASAFLCAERWDDAQAELEIAVDGDPSGLDSEFEVDPHLALANLLADGLGEDEPHRARAQAGIALSRRRIGTRFDIDSTQRAQRLLQALADDR